MLFSQASHFVDRPTEVCKLLMTLTVVFELWISLFGSFWTTFVLPPVQWYFHVRGVFYMKCPELAPTKFLKFTQFRYLETLRDIMNIEPKYEAQTWLFEIIGVQRNWTTFPGRDIRLICFYSFKQVLITFGVDILYLNCKCTEALGLIPMLDLRVSPAWQCKIIVPYDQALGSRKSFVTWQFLWGIFHLLMVVNIEWTSGGLASVYHVLTREIKSNKLGII